MHKSIKNRTPRALPLTITLGTILVVVCLVLTALWVIVLVYNNSQLKRYAGQYSSLTQWLLLGIGSFLFLLVITGVILFIVFMARQILLNQMQKSFIDSVTHELKTPLTSLKLYIETLQRHDMDKGQKERFLHTMLQDIERLDSLVNYVLAAAKLEHADHTYHFKEVDLVALLKDCTTVIQNRYELDKNRIILNLEPLNLVSDPHALQLVFINLLDNAVKYSQASESIEMAMSAQPSSGDIQITVTDKGGGIPKTEIKKIFKRFYRSKETDNQKGSGLGLFIVKQTLKNLKGHIRVKSLENQGTTFTVTLPGEHHG